MPLINENQRQQLKKFFCELENNNVRYVVLRGYRDYPERIRTDLDIACHTKDQKEYYEIAKKHFGIESKPFVKNINNFMCLYWDFSIKDKSGVDEPIHSIRMDLYNGIYFFHNKQMLLSDDAIDYIFNTRVKKFDTFYVLSEEVDMINNALRCVYDKNTGLEDKKVGKKYRGYIEDSIKLVDFGKVKRYLKLLYPLYGLVAEHMMDDFILLLKEQKYVELTKIIRYMRPH